MAVSCDPVDCSLPASSVHGILGNTIYFRYKTNQLFEPPMFSSGLDKNFVKKNYKVIYYPLEIMRSTIDAVHEVFEE